MVLPVLISWFPQDFLREAWPAGSHGGGYFMLGTVISTDMDLIGRLQPHTPTKFVPVEMEAALAARCDRHALLDEIRASLS